MIIAGCSLILLFFGLGNGEIILICLAAIVLFGSSKVSGVMKGIGKGMKTIKDEMKEFEIDLDSTMDKKSPEGGIKSNNKETTDSTDNTGQGKKSGT
jgi:sec-independent protein translocase protein TatA